MKDKDFRTQSLDSEKIYFSSPYLLCQTEQSHMESPWRRQISLFINAFSLSVIDRKVRLLLEYCPICHTARVRKINEGAGHLKIEQDLMWPRQRTPRWYSLLLSWGYKLHLSWSAAPQILMRLIGLGHPWFTQKSDLRVAFSSGPQSRGFRGSFSQPSHFEVDEKLKEFPKLYVTGKNFRGWQSRKWNKELSWIAGCCNTRK